MCIQFPHECRNVHLTSKSYLPDAKVSKDRSSSSKDVLPTNKANVQLCEAGSEEILCDNLGFVKTSIQ